MYLSHIYIYQRKKVVYLLMLICVVLILWMYNKTIMFCSLWKQMVLFSHKPWCFLITSFSGVQTLAKSKLTDLGNQTTVFTFKYLFISQVMQLMSSLSQPVLKRIHQGHTLVQEKYYYLSLFSVCINPFTPKVKISILYTVLHTLIIV